MAVVSSDDKIEFCKSLNARGVINRKDFDHWGMLPHWKDNEGYAKWVKGVRSFGRAIWDAVGEKRTPESFLSIRENPPFNLLLCL